MADTSIWDSIISRLRKIERDTMPRFTAGIQTTASISYMRSGIQSVANSVGITGIKKSWQATYERTQNVIESINDSMPEAFRKIEAKLRGISIEDIKPILRNMLKDIAIYVGGSTAVGAGIGAAAGSVFFGAGAIPGAGVGAVAGMEVGNLILAFTGLKSVIVFMKDAVPAAIKCYAEGFKDAWGQHGSDLKYGAFKARIRFADGHVLFIMALLMGIVAYLTRGGGKLPVLLAEIRNSARLGPKMATWIEQHEGDLLTNPALQQSVRAGAGGAAEDEAAKVVQGPLRGQKAPNAIDPNAPPPREPVTPRTATQLRNAPGVATISGALAPASGRWLDASVPASIPKQVGDALAGKSFNSFDDLRAAIWEEIGKNPELNSGFSKQNLNQMQMGNAPFAPDDFLSPTNAFGDRFNLHHIEPISDGGSVYDLSNLQIVSPKTHYDLHYVDE